VDVDGTKQAARQRALPQLPSLPSPHRRFDLVMAPGYKGRKRGEVVRVRTTILQAHTHQFMGTFGGSGNGDYREELRTSAPGYHQVCDGAKASPLPDPGASGWFVWQRRCAESCPGHGSGYHRAQSRRCSPGSSSGPSRSCVPPAQVCTHPESGVFRSLYDCGLVPLAAGGPRVRLIVARHPAAATPPSKGREARRHGLRIVRHQAHRSRFFRQRRAGLVSASRVV
jgi:hypothetical protein